MSLRKIASILILISVFLVISSIKFIYKNYVILILTLLGVVFFLLDAMYGEPEYTLKDLKDENGRFKEVPCPDNPDKKSRFCGCIRYMMLQGNSYESARKICGKIFNAKNVFTKQK